MKPRTTTTDDTSPQDGQEPTPSGHIMNITVQGITITCRSEQDVIDVCEAVNAELE